MSYEIYKLPHLYVQDTLVTFFAAPKVSRTLLPRKWEPEQDAEGSGATNQEGR